jgi:S-disulfanyl-L-cysteine oxidoreductase SoxD
MMRFVLAAPLAATVWAATVAAYPVAVQAPMARASQGVYTKAQARRGASVFEDTCVACHTLSRFRGDDFATKWSDKPLAVLYKAVKTMPMGEPESLEPQDYADVVAYFLSINAYPEGKSELVGSDAAIAAVKLDAKVP